MGDWTVLTDKKDAGAAGQEPSLYPTLTENPLANIPSAPVASHPDPKIQVALQAMMNMGFSNEGGWLSSLLEAKNGDIGKVLDILLLLRSKQGHPSTSLLNLTLNTYTGVRLHNAFS